MGADPVVCAIQHAAASRGLDLDAFLVRKEAKGHGMKRQVEGPEITGRKVVVVEDTTTTGGSPMLAVEAARAVGAQVLGVATILDRETEATEVFARAELPMSRSSPAATWGWGASRVEASVTQSSDVRLPDP